MGWSHLPVGYKNGYRTTRDNALLVASPQPQLLGIEGLHPETS